MRIREWVVYTFAALLSAVATSLCATQASAQPLGGLCFDERGNPCARDERPPVGGPEALRNYLDLQARAARDQLGDAHIIDYRNGVFAIAEKPHWHAETCSAFVEGPHAPRRYIHQQ